ncbi:MAG: hypothetical protein MN733_00025 [Nitrososphaera sp.]|nr:hypothetical protein [Nitrososphaera sp.]
MKRFDNPWLQMVWEHIEIYTGGDGDARGQLQFVFFTPLSEDYMLGSLRETSSGKW